MSKENTLTVYYDALCPLCTTEVKYYERCDREKMLRFVDVVLIAFITDTLVRLFTIDIAPFKIIRLIAFRSINISGCLRRVLIGVMTDGTCFTLNKIRNNNLPWF